jgi:TPR repeat protein
MNVYALAVVVVLAVGLIVFLLKKGRRSQSQQQVAADEIQVLNNDLKLPADEIQAPADEDIVPPTTAPVFDAQPGIRAFMKGRYKEAFPLLEPAAKESNLRAQQFFTKMYYARNGVPADREKYIYWLTRAAENGDRPSRIKVKRIKSGKA